MKYNLATVIILILTVAGCAPKLGVKTGLPGGSIATISSYLHKDAMRTFEKYLDSNHSCSNFRVLDTSDITEGNDMLLDGRGRLIKGSSNEVWKLEQCGKAVEYDVSFIADGKGGNYISIREK